MITLKRKSLLVCLTVLVSVLYYSCSSSDQKVNDHVAIIQKIYDDFATGNVEAVMAKLSPEIVWNEAENFPYADQNPYVGHEQVLNGVFARLGGEWEYWNLTGVKVIGMQGDQVLSTGRYQAKNKANDQIIDSQFAHHWTLKDGIVTQFQQYTDTKQASAVTENPLGMKAADGYDKMFVYDYGNGNVLDVMLKSNEEIYWKDANGKEETDKTTTIKLDDHSLLVSWTELNKSFITLYVNFNNGETSYFGRRANGEVWGRSGTLTLKK